MFCLLHPNFKTFKQEDSDAEADAKDGEEEEDEFEEEQDVELSWGNMDYREDDEVGKERKGGRERGKAWESPQLTIFLLSIRKMNTKH